MNKGFTLVELMIVVAMAGALIIGCVLAVGAYAFGQKAYDAIPEPAAKHKVCDVGCKE